MRKKRKFQQTLRKMKLLTLFMLLGFCTCHATISAQEARIDLKMSDATLSQVFRNIEQLTEYMFIYKSEDVQSIQHINVVYVKLWCGCSGEMFGKYRVVIFV